MSEDQNGQPEDCPYGTDAVCRVENGSGSAVGTNEYNFDCGAFAKKTGVTAYTQDTDKCTGFTVSAVLVHSGKCLSGYFAEEYYPRSEGLTARPFLEANEVAP
eukprot:7013-Heterococcus_DN1.PRE.1